MNPNVRKPGESFSKYRARRKAQQIRDERWLRGRLLWHSETMGTYRRSKHGALRQGPRLGRFR